MTTTRRLMRFNAVSAAGFAVQLLTVALLTRWMALPAMAATGVAVGVAVVHNFLWHRRWTWVDRAADSAGMFATFLRFAAANGAISLAGNVLIVALAVPAFNAMTGGRSVDAATNQLSAMLGRVRMEAIGLQEPRGLMFYRDTATQRIAARIVRIASSDLATGIPGFDLVEDRDAMLLPVGVGLQMVDDAAMSGSGPTATARVPARTMDAIRRLARAFVRRGRA